MIYFDQETHSRASMLSVEVEGEIQRRSRNENLARELNNRLSEISAHEVIGKESEV